jgi:GntR family transcriptional repressor for pyruvate dehydrogenase complex
VIAGAFATWRVLPVGGDDGRCAAVGYKPNNLMNYRHGAHAIRDASEQVAVQIRHYINERGLGPGDFLGREEDLAAEFGVSRPTLREALKLLASGNLIRAAKGPGGGIFVARTATEGMSRGLTEAIAMMLETGSVTLEELLEARLVLEVPLAGLAARNPEERTLERLREAVTVEAATPGDPETLAAADLEVHRAIASTGSNRIIEALTDWIFDVVHSWMFEVVEATIAPSTILEQHRALLAALEERDSGKAERAMRDHLLYLRDVLRTVQVPSGS